MRLVEGPTCSIFDSRSSSAGGDRCEKRTSKLPGITRTYTLSSAHCLQTSEELGEEIRIDYLPQQLDLLPELVNEFVYARLTFRIAFDFGRGSRNCNKIPYTSHQ